MAMELFTETLPSAASALHPDWPQARFNVSGMFTHHPLVIALLKTVERCFDCQLPMESLHGAPAVLWNAGRPSRVPFNSAAFQASLQVLYSRNIGYFPTFTNHLLEPADLKDRRCNEILDCISQRPDLNGVIVSSDLLSKYIADKYPSLRQVASIIKVTLDRGQGRPEYYNELGRRFHRYVLHPDDGRNLGLLDQLDRDKAEIIINENCAIHCPSRVRHYELYAQWQKTASSSQPAVTLNALSPATELKFIEHDMNQIMAHCQAPLDEECLAKRKRSCNLTDPEVKAIYDLGFRHFKLQGRADNAILYAYDLIRFTLEPYSVAPLAFKAIVRAIAMGYKS